MTAHYELERKLVFAFSRKFRISPLPFPHLMTADYRAGKKTSFRIFVEISLIRFALSTNNVGFFKQCFGSGWVKSPNPDEHPGSYFRELINHFFELKYFNSLMQIGDPGWKKFGSGINIPDPQHCFQN
jgi:hypothetical protein